MGQAAVEHVIALLARREGPSLYRVSLVSPSDLPSLTTNIPSVDPHSGTNEGIVLVDVGE